MFLKGVVARDPNRSVWLLSMKRMIGRGRTLVMPAVSATVVVVVVIVVMLLCVLGQLVVSITVYHNCLGHVADDEMGMSVVLLCYVSRSVELKA